jgi:hypothetical protein
MGREACARKKMRMKKVAWVTSAGESLVVVRGVVAAAGTGDWGELWFRASPADTESKFRVLCGSV